MWRWPTWGHRGAEGADARAGDGTGILLQLPDDLFRAEIAGLPPPGLYGVATCFLPRHRVRRAELERLLTDVVSDEGKTVVGWRDVPVDNGFVGEAALRSAPLIRQLFVGAAEESDQDGFERTLYVIRRRVEIAGGADVMMPSFSSRTVVYKGMLAADQLRGFYPPGHTLLRVSAPDQVGLFWAICQWLTDRGLSIESLHAATDGGMARDVFLLSGSATIGDLAGQLSGRSRRNAPTSLS